MASYDSVVTYNHWVKQSFEQIKQKTDISGLTQQEVVFLVENQMLDRIYSSIYHQAKMEINFEIPLEIFLGKTIHYFNAFEKTLPASFHFKMMLIPFQDGSLFQLMDASEETIQTSLMIDSMVKDSAFRQFFNIDDESVADLKRIPEYFLSFQKITPVPQKHLNQLIHHLNFFNQMHETIFEREGVASFTFEPHPVPLSQVIQRIESFIKKPTDVIQTSVEAYLKNIIQES